MNLIPRLDSAVKIVSQNLCRAKSFITQLNADLNAK